MADIIINAKHQQRHDTEANWTSKDPVLLDGEMGFVTGTQKYKIGDGTSKWSALAYHTSLTDSEKSKLDGIATGANKTTVDSALSSTSTNPVQNKVINNALNGKANSTHIHDDRYYTETEINSKLSGKSDMNHTHSQYYDSGVSRKANTFLAAPNGKDGTASFRVLSAADIPTITKSKISDFAHSHSDLYYSKTDVDTKLSGKANTNHSHDLSTMINGLGEATATPSDADYFVSQYAGGGTTNTSYYRRPVSALWNFIKSKLATVAISGSYNDLSNKPSIPSVGNGTVTIKQNGASKGSFTMNQSGSTTIELTDNNTNTWRDVVNNLTSTATDKSLSAAQGKILDESKATMKALSGDENLNNITTPGLYSQGGENSIINKPSGVDAFGMMVTHNASGSYYTQLMFDSQGRSWRRFCLNGTWNAWSEDKLTDTKYTHPSYTAKSSGLYKVTVDSTGHVSGTAAVTKGDITALGIPSTNTTYPTGTASTSGITKLYTGTGTATDGTMTQSAIKSALDGKSNTGHTHDDRYYTESEVNSKLNGKANSSHTHSYLPLSGGTLTGDVGVTSKKATIDGSIPYAGSVASGIALTAMNNYKTYLGSITDKNSTWWNMISTRHRNGSGDGSGYGMTIYSTLTSDGNLYWNKQISTDSWVGQRTILDSHNYNDYAPSKSGSGASGTWGINITGNAGSASSVSWGNVSGKPSTFTPAAHTHNYAGSGSAGGSANSAAKLDTSTAGSTTQPVYFSGGKPVACSHTLGKSVPSNAVFTDTNTWRGIQNNLSSTSTSDSLSAYQGKLLNERIKNRILFQSSEPTTQSENDVWIKTTKL